MASDRQQERGVKTMPSFTVKNSDQLSSYITPLSLEDAATLMTMAFDASATDGQVYAAVYGPGNDGKPTKSALYVKAEMTDVGWLYAVVLEEYHPRKDGKAQIVFGKGNKS
jgi:hypothetical protein